jgi:PIN domain nuclease of toxin-antitoxin system
MKFLVDTNVLIWAFNNPAQIKSDITHILENVEREVFYSQISLWEISIKYGLGKLDLRGHKPEEFYSAVDDSFMQCALLEGQDLISSYNLPPRHKDPFDRMLVWQSIRGGYTLLSSDSYLETYQECGLQLILNK